MATADQLKALLQSHVEGDDDRFYAIALQVAAHAAKQGHSKLADELRKLVDQIKSKTPAQRDFQPKVTSQSRGELHGLFSVSQEKANIEDLIISAATKRKLERILQEQRSAFKLWDHGLEPRNKILLVGPPGTGKTMTAAVLAGELNLPLFTIQLDGLITKYMGETASKLRLLFEAISRTRGVYFFDEFDSIGSKRTMGNDVGEVRRILNSFLQFIENNRSESVIVAATNHSEILDRALFRRFDDVIEYKMPTDAALVELLKRRLSTLDLKAVQWPKIAKSARGLSLSDLNKIAEDAFKNAVLEDRKSINTNNLVKLIVERKDSDQ